MTQTSSGAYDVVIDGADFLTGTSRNATNEDRSKGFVVEYTYLDPEDPDSIVITPTKLYPVHVQRPSSRYTMAQALDVAIEFFKLCVGAYYRATYGDILGVEELIALDTNMGAAKVAALKAWDA